MTWNPPNEGVEFQTDFTSSQIAAADAKGAETTTPTLYYYKISFSRTLTGPDDKIYLDKFTGVPAQKTISEYKFPLYAMDRLWLFSDQKGKKNISICTAESTANVFNLCQHFAFFSGILAYLFL